MTEKLEISVPGTPIAKKRPRFVRRGKFVQTYNEQQTEEGKFLLSVMNQINGNTGKTFDGALSVRIAFFFPRPKSHFGTGKNAGKIKTAAPAHHTTKPDIDNLVKFVFDCLNEQVWKDDTQVVSLETVKKYSDEPKTEIIIERIAA